MSHDTSGPGSCEAERKAIQQPSHERIGTILFFLCSFYFLLSLLLSYYDSNQVKRFISELNRIFEKWIFVLYEFIFVTNVIAIEKKIIEFRMPALSCFNYGKLKKNHTLHHRALPQRNIKPRTFTRAQQKKYSVQILPGERICFPFFSDDKTNKTKRETVRSKEAIITYNT